jgi:hypothetical protein
MDIFLALGIHVSELGSLVPVPKSLPCAVCSGWAIRGTASSENRQQQNQRTESES